MKKPSWFRLFDLITLGLTGFLALGALAYTLAVGAQGPYAGQLIGLLITVAVAAFAITGVFMYQRKVWLDTFVWYPTYGFMLQRENWIAVTPEHFDAVIRQTIAKWAPFYSAESIIKSEVNWVWMKRNLNETAINPAHAKVNGLTIAGTHSIEVDYNSPQDELEHTSLAHEIGHVIYGSATGNWDQAVHHKFMSDHGLL